MPRCFAIAIATCLPLMAGSAASAQNTNGSGAQPDPKNGGYIYNAAGCGSCHAEPASERCDDPKTKDDPRPIGGRCLKTEFGTFYVPNITPAPETGIGRWTEEDFIRAMTQGTRPDGRNLYPAFPYTSYQHMTRSDIIDLWAYLKTLAPVEATAPDHLLSFPYNIRRGLSAWKALYLDGTPFTPDPAKSDAINRGAYLIEGPGHCGECHTPRDWLGGMIEARKLSGAPDPEGKGFTPNITPHKTGIGDWSEKDIAYALQTGITPSGDVLGGTMAKVQQNLAKLTKEDREAIAAYLKSVPPVEGRKPAKK